ncbi:ABC-2 transporter permease [Siminovitchia sp. FSL H7-0308]|uniref:MFS family permease n=1 Tax=Siminovitchia thermophila TaxID=1245522 RepID=A0ABS2R6D4_9BACI|nr:ABC-2 transporter permease [Siminovitchia thermophila]MBM7715187.1 MFS family permease [Siminovitchia thermophila]
MSEAKGMIIKMRGLFLNQYFTVEKSLRNYVFISVVIVCLLIISNNEMMLSFATWLPILFMITPAFEALKHESSSGWNKFVLALPIKRSQVVQSHYIFYSLIMLSGIILTFVLFVLTDLIMGQNQTTTAVYSIMNGVGLALIIGFVTYPLTYHYGTEKSDMILMMGVLAAIGLFFLSEWIYKGILENFGAPLSPNTNHDLLFSSSFLLINLFLFIISYFVTLQIYKRKEF